MPGPFASTISVSLVAHASGSAQHIVMSVKPDPLWQKQALDIPVSWPTNFAFAYNLDLSNDGRTLLAAATGEIDKVIPIHKQAALAATRSFLASHGATFGNEAEASMLLGHAIIVLTYQEFEYPAIPN